jgi:hypothetical protein
MGFPASSPPNIDKSIRLGLSAAREMEKTGFVSKPDDSAPRYPIDETVSAHKVGNVISVATIPSAQISSRDGESWNIFNVLTGDPAETARRIVTEGPDNPLAKCPVQQFGDLLSVERNEQESLRGVIDAVQARMQLDIKTPTSIGVMGPPGAGKKFVASNIAKHLAKHLPDSSNVKILRFNSQLVRLEDITALCHEVRDHTVQGFTTVVIFENSEALMDSNDRKSKELLVMMQDGQYIDQGHTHAIGRPLLLFLVNTDSPTLDNLQTPVVREIKERRSDDVNLLENLHCAIQIAGPNQTNLQDKWFPVRRAMMLRNMLVSDFPHLKNHDGSIKVDDAVLHALLHVPTYKHGLRSLSKMLSTSRLTDRKRTKFDISALPPEEQIQNHVDGRIFMSYLRSPKLPASLREKLAQELFATYKKKRVAMAQTEEKRRELETDPSMYDWPELAAHLKESTRAQADDIPRKLRAVNCFMVDTDRDEVFTRVHEFTSSELDMLSEMEHERFNAERLQRQWKMGARDSDQKRTPFLVPWEELSAEWRDVDRVMVECVPRALARNDWKIYRNS